MNVVDTQSVLVSEVADSPFTHLSRMSDERGLFEHAAGTERREGHGYCTDDNARLLVVTSREPRDESAKHLSHLALNFVLDALDAQGRCHNRMDRSGRWADRPRTNDWWGRSIWGFGCAVNIHDDASVRHMAMEGFECAIQQRSLWPRSMAFAALGAAEVLKAQPDHVGARSLLNDVLTAIPATPVGAWDWPEARLTYANASLPEAMILAGAALERESATAAGLRLLAWLLDRETVDGHLSVTGTGGQGPSDSGPFFDQQPIEVSAMADACWSAHQVTGDSRWTAGIAAAVRWFNGDNDAGQVMFDTVSGGGHDGLQHGSVNLNQGAESTLAFISTMQRARSLTNEPIRP